MEKVKVRICTGTTCFVMGAAHLQRLDEVVSKSIRDSIEIEGCRCFGFCNEKEYGKPPFVKVDDEVVCEATIDKVMAVIERKLAGRED